MVEYDNLFIFAFDYSLDIAFFSFTPFITDFVILQIFQMLTRINARVLFVLLMLIFGVVFYIGASASPIIVFVFTICIISLFFSVFLTKWVLAKDEGPPEMSQVLPNAHSCTF